MDLTFSYLGQSDLKTVGRSRVLSLAPNLARPAVAFDGALTDPLRFREAMSALHDVVINDLRYRPRDKSAYKKWKAEQHEIRQRLRREVAQKVREEIQAAESRPVPPELQERYDGARKYYWNTRNRFARHLFWRDHTTWRRLMPCDPIITVADDVVFFECFSADESSYGCLTVDRDDAFAGGSDLQTGTTNVDYSWALYNHFQSLRSYRETRFVVDPAGFEVVTAERANLREEKIDLPAGWLRGFLQLQSAMTMPMRKVPISREAVYSILAWLKRNKAKTSPRALRFELKSGQAPELVLEPWEKRIISRGTGYHGPNDEPIRIWGRRRLLTLARVLPLAERFDVHLLGTGLPSFWVAQLGGMRLTLGLSGWTTNDWTRGSALDVLAPPAELSAGTLSRIATDLEQRGAASFDALRDYHKIDPAQLLIALNKLAHTGEVIHDLSAGMFRWRRIMPNALGEADLGPENPELAESRRLIANKVVEIHDSEAIDGGGKHLTGKAGGKPVELWMDLDGRITKGRCVCGHHQKAGLRMGPCRHLLALRSFDRSRKILPDTKMQIATTRDWFQRLKQWSNA